MWLGSQFQFVLCSEEEESERVQGGEAPQTDGPRPLPQSHRTIHRQPRVLQQTTYRGQVS